MRPIAALIMIASLAAQAQAQDPAAPDDAAATDASVAAGDEEGDGRIVGGVEARAGSAPWQIQIFAKGAAETTQADIDADKLRSAATMRFLAQKPGWELNHRCGGALIAPDWIVTAAHCARLPEGRTGSILDERGVRIGTQDLTVGGATYRIERAVIHKLYDSTKHIHDIALMRIVPDRPAGRRLVVNARPIRILGSKPKDLPLDYNPNVTVTGWGLTGARETSLFRATDGSVNHKSPRLMEVALTILPASRCEAKPILRSAVIPQTICAGSSDGRDTCQGDSGGPMTRAEGTNSAGKPERVLVGLVSYGYGCGVKNMPGIYVNVREYRGWIAAAIKASAAGAAIKY